MRLAVVLVLDVGTTARNHLPVANIEVGEIEYLVHYLVETRVEGSLLRGAGDIGRQSPRFLPRVVSLRAFQKPFDVVRR